MPTVRPMTVDDIPAALALWQGAEGVTLRGADRPEVLTRFLARNPGCSFVALVGGEVVGVSLAGHDGRRGYLHHVVVHRDRRRHGLGRRLVEACTAALKDAGIEKVNFFVKADNPGGLAFWLSVGGLRRDDLVGVSLILSDDPNA